MSSPVYTAHGKTQTLHEWGSELGIKWKTLWARINNGASVELALSTSFVKKQKQRDMTKIIEKVCAGCKRPFLIPQCRDWRENSCSTECKNAVRAAKAEALKESRARSCQFCGCSFVAKSSQIKAGEGRFCSLKCSFEAVTRENFHGEAARIKARATWREGYETGRFKFLSGPANPHWRGGRIASSRRQYERPGSAERRREYLAKNAHRKREWSQKRSGGYVKRLPWGTIQKLEKAQRMRCAICKVKLKPGYHLDHIMPIKLGGLHEPLNLQLLCPTCNVRKNAKHPIDYMQQRGFLL